MKKIIALVLAALLAAFSLTACSGGNTSSVEPSSQAPKATVKIGMLKGPTGIGAVKMQADSDAGKTANQYQISYMGAPDEITGKIISGELDMAAVPTNLASTLYKKTNGNVQLLALNTLGVLYILEKGDSIQSVKDLAGKTIYATGQGSTPEYALNYILEKNGIKDQVKVEYKTEHSELAALALSGKADIILLPEPFVTNVQSKDASFRTAIDLTKEWENAEENGTLTMGCLIVRKDYAEQNKAVVDAFLNDYQASVKYTETNVEQTADLAVAQGLLPSKEVAQKAIPNCNIVCITGQEMKTKTAQFLSVLLAANPQSVGGQLPDDAFYYQQS